MLTKEELANFKDELSEWIQHSNLLDYMIEDLDKILNKHIGIKINYLDD